ncbi:MAG: radical SAM protein [Planctomycetales bacterium]|nr:radical SAM protein [Planctomycetales bacterium]
MSLVPLHAEAARVRPSHLDQLWFQVAGTRCNFTCAHCFISCSPHNDAFGFLSFDDVAARLCESVALGVKEYYFTGGEPFLHRDMTRILMETLRYGPATVLTNATTLKDEQLAQLAAAEAASLYSLEFRVSLDGCSPETNDPIRGAGTFARTMAGVRQLVAHGFLPIITAARTWSDEDDRRVVDDFLAVLRDVGYTRPRLKILPTLHLGAEQQRSRAYRDSERVTAEMMDGFDASALLCEHARIVTDRGVHVCPILIDAPDSLLGSTLAESLSPFPLRHGACFTCYQYGSICANPSSAAGEAAR